MEKIVIVIRPIGVERISLDFACYLANLTGSKLMGLLLHEERQAVNVTEQGMHFCHHIKKTEVLPSNSPADTRQIKLDFDRFCKNHNVQYEPDVKEAGGIEEVILESRFADLMILGSDSTFSTEAETIPTDTVTYILKHAECPVIVAPLSFTPVDQVVLTYDGSESSVFAIKQFTYLFPQFHNKKIVFLEVSTDYSSDINHKKMITDYLKIHYKTVGYQILKGNPEDQLFSYFLHKRNVFVVMGAFGKKLITSIFKRSTANLLLKTTSLPVFISHK